MKRFSFNPSVKFLPSNFGKNKCFVLIKNCFKNNILRFFIFVPETDICPEES